MRSATAVFPHTIVSVPRERSAGVAVVWQSLAPSLQSLLRIIAAFVFLQYGSAKLFAVPGPLLPGGATASAGSLIWFAGVLELCGGLLLLAGFLTRPVAFLLAGEMTVAYLTQHAPRNFWPVLNQGQPAVLFAFIWLYVSAAGPGPWSVDAWRARRRQE
ncbi:MAG: DoxX family protein [Gemmatimonadales bacterium]